MNLKFTPLVVLLGILLAATVAVADYHEESRLTRKLLRSQEYRGEERRLHGRTRNLIRRLAGLPRGQQDDEETPKIPFLAPKQTQPIFQLPKIVSNKYSREIMKDIEILRTKYSAAKDKALFDKWQDLIYQNDKITQGTSEWKDYQRRVRSHQSKFEKFQKGRLALIKKLKSDSERSIKQVDGDDAAVMEAELEGFFGDALNVVKNAGAGVVNAGKQWVGEVGRDIKAIVNVKNLAQAGRDLVDTVKNTGRTLRDGAFTAGNLMVGNTAAAKRSFESMKKNGKAAMDSGIRVYNNPAVQGAIDLAKKGKQVYEAVQTGGTSLIIPAMMAAGQGALKGNTKYDGVPEFNRIQAPNFKDLAKSGLKGLGKKLGKQGLKMAQKYAKKRWGAKFDSLKQSGLDKLKKRLPKWARTRLDKQSKHNSRQTSGSRRRPNSRSQSGRSRSWRDNAKKALKKGGVKLGGMFGKAFLGAARGGFMNWFGNKRRESQKRKSESRRRKRNQNKRRHSKRPSRRSHQGRGRHGRRSQRKEQHGRKHSPRGRQHKRNHSQRRRQAPRRTHGRSQRNQQHRRRQAPRGRQSRHHARRPAPRHSNSRSSRSSSTRRR